MDTVFLNKLKNSTPVIQSLETFMDADEEMKEIADYIKRHNQHNEYIEIERIKFLYSPKPKKDGSRYVIFELFKRSDIDKMINDEFDFILTAFYDVWSKLEPEQKIIQLDKALCGIDINVNDNVEPKPKKKAPDSKEYVSNMLMYGPEKVMRISEQVDLACQTAIEQRKENAKNRKHADNDIDAVIADNDSGEI